MERQPSAANSTQSERPPRPETMYRRFTSMPSSHGPPPPPTVDQFMGRLSTHARSSSVAASDSALLAHPIAVPVDVQVSLPAVSLPVQVIFSFCPPCSPHCCCCRCPGESRNCNACLLPIHFPALASALLAHPIAVHVDVQMDSSAGTFHNSQGLVNMTDAG